VGQVHVTQTLSNELNFSRISHAYLFVGPRGTGKTTCAKILAKAVNCLNLNNGNACCECEICRGIEDGSIMDVMELDAASNNSVNDIRSLCENAYFIPARSKYRVYIIDEVHMLSAGAFAALLKTLEEPPLHVIFILATTEIHKLPATILSRCQRFEFNRIDNNVIAERLLHIANCENIELGKDAALMIARSASGALRDALSLLDKCAGVQKVIDIKTISDILGLVSKDYLSNLISFIKEGNIAKILKLLDEIYLASKDMLRLCEELIQYFRNIMIAKIVDNSKEILSMTDEEHKEISVVSSWFSLSEIIFILDEFQNCLNKSSTGYSDHRIELELTLIKVCERRNKGNSLSVSSPSQSGEDGIKSKIHEDSIEIEPEVNHSETEFPSLLKAEGNIKKELMPMNRWPEVIKKLEAHSKVIAAAFSGSTAYISGNFILIDAPKKVAFELLRKSAQRDQVRVAVQDITGVSYKLGPYKNSESGESRDKNQLREFIKRAENEGIPVTEIN
jgi:DNA polymerase-3 subunit gamma/tau